VAEVYLSVSFIRLVMSTHTLNQTLLGSASGFPKPLTRNMSLMITGLVVIGSIRGIIVLNTSLSPNLVYRGVAALLMMVSALGILTIPQFKSTGFGRLKTLAYLNLVLGGLNLVVDHLFLLYPLAEGLGMLYVYIAPFILFVQMKVDPKHLRIGIAVITIAITYSVLDNFYQLLSGPDGAQRVIDYNLRLSPTNRNTLSQGSGATMYRVGGYTGSYHDSANILGMSVCYFFIRSLLKRNLVDMGLALTGIVGLTITQSASNIVIVGVTLFFSTTYLLWRTRDKMTVLYLMLFTLGLGFLVWRSGGVMIFFTSRLSNWDYWSGMFHQLDRASLTRLLPFAMVGHFSAVGDLSCSTGQARLCNGITEVSFLRYLYQLGIVHTTILFTILVYPVWRWFRVRRRCAAALPAVAAILCGFMTLSHYASLFRVTSQFLFYAFGAICLNYVMETQHEMRLERAKSVSS